MSTSRPLPLLRHLQPLKQSERFTQARSQKWDAVVVGGGHNGLVSAAYLAKSGMKVLVCERRHILGGAAVTEEIVPGFHFSRASYVYSLFRPQIVTDLKLKDYGLEVLKRDPSSFTPTTGSQSLILSDSLKDTQESIGMVHISNVWNGFAAQFSKKDADMWPKYNALLEDIVEKFGPLLDRSPPDLKGTFDKSLPWNKRKHNLKDFFAFARSLGSLQGNVGNFYDLLTAPAAKILNQKFEGDILKATLATDSVIGALTSPYSPQSAYVLLHHVMGEIDGEKGAWGYVRGGMGGVSASLAAAAEDAGATLLTNVQIKNVLTTAKNGKEVVGGVELEDGTLIESDHVLWGASPQALQAALPSSSFSEEDTKLFQNVEDEGASTKINIAVDSPPNFTCAPNKSNKDTMPHHRATIHFEHHMDQIHDAYLDATQDHLSRRPVIEMTIPSSLDSTLAPEGKHVVQLFVQYTPYTLKDTKGWTEDLRKDFVNRVFDVIEEYAPGFKSSVIEYDALFPPDLEKTFGLPKGNIFHMSMGLDQLFWSRPVPGYSRYSYPLGNLFLCGAGAHPGGGVMGAPGRNAAMELLRQRNSQRGPFSFLY